MAHSKVDNTFNGAMDKLKELSSVFREGGKLEAACSEDCDLSEVRTAFEELMGTMREAHTEATMEESVTEGSMKDKMMDDAENMDHDDFCREYMAQGVSKEECDEMWKSMNEAASVGAPDYNPSRGEYASNREYGMFSDEGNAEVAELVDDIVKRHEAGEFGSPERAIDAAMSDLMTLSDDNDDFAEASDTDVRDQVARDLDMRIGRDSGFGEAIDYMKKLAGLE